MSLKTPAIGISGIFELTPPFSLQANTVYTVEGHRSFNELILDAFDPVERIYAPLGLTIDDYQRDSTTPGALVIILVSKSNERVLVPNTYIAGYPNTAVVPHSWVVAAISCGILPDTYDFQRLREAIQETVSSFIGVEPNVHFAQKKTHDVVTEERAAELEVMRNAAITYRETNYADKLKLQQRVLELEAEVQDLIGIIQSNP